MSLKNIIERVGRPYIDEDGNKLFLQFTEAYVGADPLRLTRGALPIPTLDSIYFYGNSEPLGEDRYYEYSCEHANPQLIFEFNGANNPVTIVLDQYVDCDYERLEGPLSIRERPSTIMETRLSFREAIKVLSYIIEGLGHSDMENNNPNSLVSRRFVNINGDHVNVVANVNEYLAIREEGI